MANPEHLEILRQGVETWNDWRKQNLNAQPKLDGANLHGANLSEANLIEANLFRATLIRARPTVVVIETEYGNGPS